MLVYRKMLVYQERGWWIVYACSEKIASDLAKWTRGYDAELEHMELRKYDHSFSESSLKAKDYVKEI